MTKPYLLVPAYDKYDQAKEDLHNLLKSLELGAYQKHFRVLVLLDGCHRIFEHEFKSQYKDFEFHNHTGNPRNFTANTSIGLRKAREEGVGALVVNMDTIMPKSQYIISRMVFEDRMTCAASIENGDLNEICESVTSQAFTDVRTVVGGKVAGFCFWLGSKVLQKIGVLDDANFKASFEDDDITVRALLAGFRVELAPVFVRHVGTHINQVQKGSSRTGAYSPNDGSLMLHKEKFYRKWSIPSSVAHKDALEWILSSFQWTEEMVVN